MRQLVLLLSLGSFACAGGGPAGGETTPSAEAPPPPPAAPAPAKVTPTAPADAPAEATTPPVVRAAIAQGSALVRLDDGTFVGVNDEEQLLVHFSAAGARLGAWPLPATLTSLDPKSKPDNIKEVDLEGLTRATLDGKPILVFTGSHGRTKRKVELNKKTNVLELDGNKLAPNRRQVFATLLPSSPAPGTPYAELSLVAAPRTDLALALDAAAAELPPNQRGIDIEGLTWQEEGDLLWFGLRSPVADGKARVVAVPMRAWLLEGKLEIVRSEALDLGGRGVRSLEADGATIWVLGGPTPVCAESTEGGALSLRDTATPVGFALFQWSPKPGAAGPQLVTDKLPVPRPEGITRDAKGIWLLSDDGAPPDGDACGGGGPKRDDSALGFLPR